MRNEALQKLAQTRINLSNELAELINSQDDLTGEFSSEYSKVSEEVLELGDKIVKIGFILTHMPQDDQPKQQPQQPSQHPTWDNLMHQHDVSVGDMRAALEPPSWDKFVDYVRAPQLNPSAAELSRLLRVDVQTAMRCVAHFASLLERDFNETIGKLNSLGAQLKINTNGSLNLLRELFNLQGDTAVSVYERLKATTA